MDVDASGKERWCMRWCMPWASCMSNRDLTLTKSFKLSERILIEVMTSLYRVILKVVWRQFASLKLTKVLLIISRVQFRYTRFLYSFRGVSQAVCGAHLRRFAWVTTQLFSWRTLHWYRVSGSAPSEQFPCTHTVYVSAEYELYKRQELFFKFSAWVDRESNPAAPHLLWRVFN